MWYGITLCWYWPLGRMDVLEGLSTKRLSAMSLCRSQVWGRYISKALFSRCPQSYLLWIHWDGQEIGRSGPCNFEDSRHMKLGFLAVCSKKNGRGEHLTLTSVPLPIATTKPKKYCRQARDKLTVYFKLLVRSCYLFKTSNEVTKS